MLHYYEYYCVTSWILLYYSQEYWTLIEVEIKLLID